MVLKECGPSSFEHIYLKMSLSQGIATAMTRLAFKVCIVLSLLRLNELHRLTSLYISPYLNFVEVIMLELFKNKKLRAYFNANFSFMFSFVLC